MSEACTFRDNGFDISTKISFLTDGYFDTSLYFFGVCAEGDADDYSPGLRVGTSTLVIEGSLEKSTISGFETSLFLEDGSYRQSSNGALNYPIELGKLVPSVVTTPIIGKAALNVNLGLDFCITFQGQAMDSLKSTYDNLPTSVGGIDIGNAGAKDFFFDIYEEEYCGIDARDKVLKFVELFDQNFYGAGEALLMKPLAEYFTKNSPGGTWPIPVYNYRLDLNKVCKKDSLTTYNKIAAPFETEVDPSINGASRTSVIGMVSAFVTAAIALY